MSHIYNQYFADCQSAYQPCGSWIGNVCNKDELCKLSCRDRRKCIDCLTDIFFDNHKRTYKCFSIIYSYVMRFLNSYASEIYHILYDQDELWDNINNKNIMSLGCGPATELIAIEKLLRDKNKDVTWQYIGFDPNIVWIKVHELIENIFKKYNLTNLCFEYGYLLPENEKLQETKLLILNYVVSDVFSHSSEILEEKTKKTLDFLQDKVNAVIVKMPINSYILINDINSNNMGRDEIEAWSISAGLKIISIDFFEHTGRYYKQCFSDTSSKIGTKPYVFEDTVEDIYFNRKDINECHSAFILLKKEAPARQGIRVR